MVEIFPLNGFTYNKKKLNDFSTVITPPYDIISKEKRTEFKTKSNFNFVNLILSDSDKKCDKYQHAANLLTKWEKKNILVQDKEKTIYVYSQGYYANKKNFRRIGFISLIKLEDFGEGVLPHEKILTRELEDRFHLISNTKANLEIPFLLYDDKEKIIDTLIQTEIGGKEPFLDFSDENKVHHRLWKVSDKEVIDKIQNEMKKYQCVIADGHHRYTAELKFKDGANIEGAEYGLMCFINSFNEGSIILPTNRIVFGLEIDMDIFLKKIGEYFNIVKVDEIAELVKRMESIEIMINKQINLKNHVFGIYSNINKQGYLIKLKDEAVLDKITPDKTNIYNRLDVNILHKIIIEKILGITEEQQRNKEHIAFIKGNEEMIKIMEDKNIQFAFFVNPPLMREVFLTARAGEIMPQKSTYFYPKIYSGLVIYKIEKG